MNRIRMFALGAALAIALPALAQQAAQPPATVALSSDANQTVAYPSHQLPPVERHLQMLSEKLDLTADQQQKARPILEEMQASIDKVLDDKSLTPDEAHEQMHPAMFKADKEIRVFLTDEQKKKLDQLEADMHPPSQK